MMLALALTLGFAASPDPCAAPEYHGLDFWLGAWSVHSSDPEAASSIEPLGAGCAVLESYREPGGYSGQSLHYRDPQDGRWHQLWMDSAGAVSEFTGTPRAAEGIDFEGFTRPAGGGRVLRRMTLSPEAGSVRQRSWLSRDAGKTWQDHYSLEYRRALHPSLAGPCTAPSAPDAEERVRRVVSGIVAAHNARALDDVLALYAPDAVLLPPADAPVAGAETIRARYARLFKGLAPAIEGRVEKICVAGSVAIVVGHNGSRMLLRDDGSGWRISVLLWRPRRPASPASE